MCLRGPEMSKRVSGAYSSDAEEVDALRAKEPFV